MLRGLLTEAAKSEMNAAKHETRTILGPEAVTFLCYLIHILGGLVAAYAFPTSLIVPGIVSLWICSTPLTINLAFREHRVWRILAVITAWIVLVLPGTQAFLGGPGACSAAWFIYLWIGLRAPGALGLGKVLHETDRISPKLHRLIWILGLANTATAFFSPAEQHAASEQAASLSYGYLIPYGALSLLFLWAIYVDMEEIDEGLASEEYGAWIGQRWERILRFMILAALLFGVGEVASLVVLPTVNTELQNDALRANISHFITSTHLFFKFGSITAFLLIALWNGFGIAEMTDQWRNNPPDKPLEKAANWLTGIRMFFFAAVSILSALFYMLPGVHLEKIAILYFIIGTVVIVLRADASSRRIRRNFADWIDNSDRALTAARTEVTNSLPDRGAAGRTVGPGLPPEERQRWFDAITEIYAEMKARAKTGAYTTSLAGLSVIVHPDVYAPGFFTDSGWFAKEVASYSTNGSLLEIGTGTGFISMYCKVHGATTVLATDVSPLAVQNAVENFAELGLPDMEVSQGEVFDSVPSGRRFDCIFWAHPFNNYPEPVDDLLWRSGLDYGYRDVSRYIKEGPNYLTPNGRLLLGTGNSADLASIQRFAEEAGLALVLLASAELPLRIGKAEMITYLLYELRPKSPIRVHNALQKV